MAAPDWASQVDPGTFIDKQKNIWKGTWENATNTGQQWTGAMPGENDWVQNPYLNKTPPAATPPPAVPAPTPTAPTAPATSPAAQPSGGIVANPTNTAYLQPGAAPTVPGPDERLNPLFDLLMQRAGQGLTVDANSPVVKSQVDAARLNGERSLLRNEQSAAARQGPYATGALDANARAEREGLAGTIANTTAGAIGHEVDARRAEIAQALSGALGVLSQSDAVKLKMEDQLLTQRQQDLTKQGNDKQLDLQAQQQEWMQKFQEAGYTADQAARLWQQMFAQRGQDLGQANTVWNQQWLTSGGQL